MSIIISIPTKTRDFSSGYEVDTNSTFELSIYEAESIVRSLNAQILAEQARQKNSRLSEIQRLESQLRALKGEQK